MERESFEDAADRRAMNEHFVCIKVDREERPDVDAIYMDAVQAMTGHGGWPLNAFLTPDGVPFYAGTYFPPEPRQGMPSWRAGAGRRSAQAWREQREEIDAQAGAILARLRGAAALEAPDGRARPGLARRRRRRRCAAATTASTAASAARRSSRAASAIEFLLAPRRARDGAAHAARDGERRHVRPGRRRLRALLGRRALARPALREDALRQRAARARVPARAGRSPASRCFEARVRARRSTGRCASCARRRAASPRALDADSEGVEGKFYVWTPDEVREALGDELADVAIEHFGMTEAGNFEGANIPVRATPDPDALPRDQARGCYAAREQRVRPGLDDKRLTRAGTR